MQADKNRRRDAYLKRESHQYVRTSFVHMPLIIDTLTVPGRQLDGRGLEGRIQTYRRSGYLPAECSMVFGRRPFVDGNAGVATLIHTTEA